MAQPSYYFRPSTIQEALQLIGKSGQITLSGGAFAFAELDLPYETVIDLQQIAELKTIERQNKSLVIGSGANLQSVVDSELVPSILKKSITRSIGPNHRNGSSVLETLLFPLAIPEWTATLYAMEAQATVIQANGEQITVPLIEGIDSQQGIATSITVPILDANEAISAAYVARTPASVPIVTATVYIKATTENKIATARAAIYGSCQDPYILLPLAIGGYPLDSTSIEGAAELVSTETDPIGDYLGSVEYRREMAGVCVKRALMQCFDKINS